MEDEDEFEDLATLIYEIHMGWPMGEATQKLARRKLLQVLESEDARKVFVGWKSWLTKTPQRVRTAHILHEYYCLLDDGITHLEAQARLAPKFSMSPDGIKKIYDRAQGT